MNKKSFENKIEGFSKISKKEKINWIEKNYFNSVSNSILKKYWNKDDSLQKIHDEFIENTLSNFYLPLGVAPNFLIDNKDYTIPMVIEESSVIAAACKAAKFWRNKGGFKTSILNFKKTGQVHFIFKGDKQKLNIFFKNNKLKFFEDCKEISSNMKKRGGGILNIELLDKTHDIDNYFQINAVFDTVDSMGANFINSCLEQFASTLKNEIKLCSDINSSDYSLEIIMSILSNYVPECLVRAEVSCDLNQINQTGELSGKEYANKFIQAINIAKTQTSRAVTHNKGIMNGIDSVVIATGNDFRAIEAGVHAYAAKSGMYKSLTDACVENNTFKFWIEIPLALGTIGGITNLHPLVKWSLELLKNPNAKELMKIVAVAGLAQNFGAVNSLITTGIQKGHMKMHLINILNSLNASENEKTKLIDFFKNNTVSFSSVKNELEKLR
ncbi:hydroxymethylglutaryl-CoA reductase, degradative [Flavobacteriaceae bacterium]|jgi:hydroxymethylglutaryl-CoA reductase|nr:hydroxymethylglutaryl-CoA reductase, degradative [Flavobacteriaceae bacterium]